LVRALQWKPLLLYMINLQSRSYQKELLDSGDIPFADIRQNMKELNSINTLLGGHAISVKGLREIIRQHPPNQSLSICEIGCGGGDNLLALSKWCVSNNIGVNFIGIDIKLACIEFATKQCEGINAKWITGDYLQTNFATAKPDIIFSSLFCHHFSETELSSMLRWMKDNCSKGFFINDLHRHALAYYSIKLITGLFSKSYLVKNDAPLSVARGFKKNEWKAIFKTAGIGQYHLSWQWAFRHLIIYCNE
jgi:2-polyprenyl-3-methyl-5-hydroxy-6-metoxy-1,4-benzoquinol methylase